MRKGSKSLNAYLQACEIVGVKTHKATANELSKGIILKDGNKRYSVDANQRVRLIRSSGRIMPVYRNKGFSGIGRTASVARRQKKRPLKKVSGIVKNHTD